MQIETTGMLIGAAGVVALACDYLRNRGQRYESHAAPALQHGGYNRGESSAPETVSSLRVNPFTKEAAAPAEPVSEPTVEEAPLAAMPAPELPVSSESGLSRARRLLSPSTISVPEINEMNPRKALTEWLDQRAAARATQKKAPAVSPAEELSGAAAELVEPELVNPAETETAPVEHVHFAQRALDPAPPSEPIAAPVAEVEEIPGSVQVNSDVIERLAQETSTAPAQPSFADLWRAMGSPAKPAIAKPAAEPRAARFELIHGAGSTVSSPDMILPEGMHDESFLRRAMAAGKRFSGFIVSISVSDSEGRAPIDADLMRSISVFVSGLLREGEFGCRRSADEFIILCPGQHGAEAQRRLTGISEQLWDYQLRFANRFKVVFTWGSAETQHESLGEGVAEAIERMSDVRRTRRLVSVDMLRSQPRSAAI